MLQSQLCKQAACLRHSFEGDGYMLLDVHKLQGCRQWYYQHPNGNRVVIYLDLYSMSLKVYKNAKLIKTIQ